VTGLPGLSLTIEAVVRDARALTGKAADLQANSACRGQAGGNYLWQAQFDYDKIIEPLILRNRRPGDRICPAGMGGRSKKLQDLFTDEKVPRLERDRVPVLAAGDTLLWAVGIRTDERFLPGPGTRNVLVVKVRQHP
jgi:tRNA(Ile)-lysidine synthetase-like protein